MRFPMEVRLTPAEQELARAIGSHRNSCGWGGQALSYTTTGSDEDRNIAAVRAEIAAWRVYRGSTYRLVQGSDNGVDLNYLGLGIDVKWNGYGPDRAFLYFNGVDRDHALSTFKADVALLVLPGAEKDVQIYGYITRDEFGELAQPPPWAASLNPLDRPSHRRRETPWGVPASSTHTPWELGRRTDAATS